MRACLDDYVCLVTGASRGIGRGIAIGLGERGATVYITGRTLKSAEVGEAARSLEATAAEINSRGGKAIPVLVDHSDEGQVAALFQRIQREQRGRLDVLVNNVYSAVPFLFKSLKKPFYECEDLSPGEAWDLVNNVGLRNHYVCATLATKMMLNYQAGLIVNVSSIGGKIYAFSTLYGVGECIHNISSNATSQRLLYLRSCTHESTDEAIYQSDCGIVSLTLVSSNPGILRMNHQLPR
ncbi:unnamed protein product [Echinostoma caproni]|uniref:Dehydrogenase/reductase SDR family member 1 n=1 Tax=Echinostoma caproni TaxID=27848 RepID=A0A183B190_9TREM|nr:unnamed protein product [Echinostoma caproni]